MSRPQEPPMSPCVRVCRLDAEGQFCVACWRSRDEITQWWGLGDDQKRAVLAACDARREAARPSPSS